MKSFAQTQRRNNFQTNNDEFLIIFLPNRTYREWDGMIKELLEQRADLAIADLTITFDREQVRKLKVIFFI